MLETVNKGFKMLNINKTSVLASQKQTAGNFNRGNFSERGSFSVFGFALIVL